MLKIKIKKGNIERSLKEYRSKVIKTHQMRILNENKEFDKPSVVNRRKKQKSVYKYKKRNGDY
jgi:ribosomal protein S21